MYHPLWTRVCRRVVQQGGKGTLLADRQHSVLGPDVLIQLLHDLHDLEQYAAVLLHVNSGVVLEGRVVDLRNEKGIGEGLGVHDIIPWYQDYHNGHDYHDHCFHHDEG